MLIRLEALTGIFQKPFVRRCIIILLVLGAFTLSVYIRILPALRYGEHLPGDDPLLHYRMTEYVVKNGTLPSRDPYAWHPWSYNPNYVLPVLHYYVGAYLYKLSKIFVPDLSIHDFCVYIPAVFSSFAIPLVYLIGREVWDESSGVFAAFGLATVLAYYERTFSSFYRHEQFAIPGILLSIYLLIRAFKSEELYKTIIYSMMSGFASIYVAGMWKGFRFLLDGYALFMLLLVLLGRIDLKSELSLSITMLYTVAGTLWFSNLAYTFFPDDLEAYIAYGAILSAVIYELLPRLKLKVRYRSLFSILLSIVIMLLPYLGLGTPLRGRLLRVVNPFTEFERGSVVYTVAEHSTGRLFFDFNFLLPIALVGLIFFAKKWEDESSLLVMLATLTSLYFAWSMARLPPLAAPFVAVASGITWSQSYKTLKDRIKTVQRIKQVRAKKRRKAKTRYDLLISPLLLSLLVITCLVGSSVQTYRLIPSLAYSDPLDPEWQAAFKWLRENADTNDVIMSWWDYGYWIVNGSMRVTMADGLTINSSQIRVIAMAFMGSEEEAYDICMRYNISYVVVDLLGELAGNSGQLFSGDGKWVAIGWIAKKFTYNPYSPKTVRQFYQYDFRRYFQIRDSQITLNYMTALNVTLFKMGIEAGYNYHVLKYFRLVFPGNLTEGTAPRVAIFEVIRTP